MYKNTSITSEKTVWFKLFIPETRFESNSFEFKYKPKFSPLSLNINSTEASSGDDSRSSQIYSPSSSSSSDLSFISQMATTSSNTHVGNNPSMSSNTNPTQSLIYSSISPIASHSVDTITNAQSDVPVTFSTEVMFEDILTENINVQDIFQNSVLDDIYFSQTISSLTNQQLPEMLAQEMIEDGQTLGASQSVINGQTLNRWQEFEESIITNTQYDDDFFSENMDVFDTVDPQEAFRGEMDSDQVVN